MSAGMKNQLKREKKLNMPDKTFQAIESLKKLLNTNGKIIITVPIGYNPNLDNLLKSGKIKFDERLCLKRVSKDNRWIETDWTGIENLKFNHPFPFANGLLIGVIKAIV